MESQLKHFILEYVNLLCLYNTLLKDYKDREKRKTALKELANLFLTSGRKRRRSVVAIPRRTVLWINLCSGRVQFEFPC